MEVEEAVRVAKEPSCVIACTFLHVLAALTADKHLRSPLSRGVAVIARFALEKRNNMRGELIENLIVICMGTVAVRPTLSDVG